MSRLPDWYDDWAVAHCIAFGFGDEQAKTVFAWGPVFTALFTSAELAAATGLLLRSADAPRFASDHRAAVIRAVEAGRLSSTRRAAAEAAPSGCEVCGGLGQVIVPHPGLTDDGREWRATLRMPSADPSGVARTSAVCCVVCEAGRRARTSTEAAGRPQMTMAQYEHRYPYWREVQFEREQVLRARQTAPTTADVKRLNDLLAKARDHAARKAA